MRAPMPWRTRRARRSAGCWTRWLAMDLKVILTPLYNRYFCLITHKANSELPWDYQNVCFLDIYLLGPFPIEIPITPL